MSTHVEFSSLLEALLGLEGDQKIFVSFDVNDAKRMRFLNYQKSALENVVLSYINATNELANEVNFNRFVEKIAQLTIDTEDATAKILNGHLPEEVASYIQSPATKHSYVLDVLNSVIILSREESSNQPLHVCELHSPGQEHVHTEACGGHDHDHHNHNHNHNH